MNTLVSMGISASFVWSLYALFFGGAGLLGMRMPDPGSLTVGARVPLVLTFRHAGQMTVYATVTPPGTP